MVSSENQKKKGTRQWRDVASSLKKKPAHNTEILFDFCLFLVRTVQHDCKGKIKLILSHMSEKFFHEKHEERGVLAHSRSSLIFECECKSRFLFFKVQNPRDERVKRKIIVASPREWNVVKKNSLVVCWNDTESRSDHHFRVSCKVFLVCKHYSCLDNFVRNDNCPI